MASFALYGVGLDFVIVSACLSLLFVVALIDLEHGLILDSIVFPSLILLLVLSPFWTEIGITRSFLGNETLLGSFANSALSGLGFFLAYFVLFMMNPSGTGFGDVKFAAVLGLMVGFPGVLLTIWISSVGGGLIAVALIMSGKKGRKDIMPFGPFLATGAAVVLIAGPRIIDIYQDLANSLSGA